MVRWVVVCSLTGAALLTLSLMLPWAAVEGLDWRVGLYGLRADGALFGWFEGGTFRMGTDELGGAWELRLALPLVLAAAWTATAGAVAATRGRTRGIHVWTTLTALCAVLAMVAFDAGLERYTAGLSAALDISWYAASGRYAAVLGTAMLWAAALLRPHTRELPAPAPA